MPSSWPQRVCLALVSAAFLVMGVGHCRNPELFVAMMPPWLPLHLELVYLSGAFEILGAIGILVPATRRFAGWGLVALLVAVYPANIHMALHPELFPEMSPAALYARLPFQVVFVALVWFAMRPEPAPAAVL